MANWLVGSLLQGPSRRVFSLRADPLTYHHATHRVARLSHVTWLRLHVGNPRIPLPFRIQTSSLKVLDLEFKVLDGIIQRYKLEKNSYINNNNIIKFKKTSSPSTAAQYKQQLIKDENTGDIFIVEIRREWPPGGARSQRTCYKKRLEFGQGRESSEEPPTLMLPISNRNSPIDPERECKEDSRVRHCGNIHVGDNQSDATIYTLSQCPLHTYNPSCDAFVDLVYEENSTGPFLQLRVRPKVDIVEQDQTVKLWPGKPSPSQPDDALAQLHEIINPSQSAGGVEWAMNERNLVYSSEQGLGQLRPLTLMSFDSSLRFPGFPKHPSRTTNADRASVVQPGTPELSQESICGDPGIVALSPSTCRSGEWPSHRGGDEGTSLFIRSSLPLYQMMSMGNGTQHGFDMSYDRQKQLLV